MDKYCRGPFTDYKYNVFYEVGKNHYIFSEEPNLIDNNDYNAVSKINYSIIFYLKNRMHFIKK